MTHLSEPTGRDLSHTQRKILDIVSSAAARDLPCPSNAAMADRIGVMSVATPGTALAVLAKRGLVKVILFNKIRVVEIVATGKSTQRPKGMRASRRHSPGDDAKLRELVARGRTAKEIAAAFGVTRNVIIGRAYRLGLKMNRAPTERAQEIAGIGCLGLREPNPPGCRWIEGDPREVSSHWCNAKPRPGSAYCNEHHMRCYRAPTSRTRRQHEKRKQNYFFCETHQNSGNRDRHDGVWVWVCACVRNPNKNCKSRWPATWTARSPRKRCGAP